MIDLHVHTNYSDGTWDLKKLLEEAEKAKIEVLSITDHDTVKVYKELEKIDYKKVYSGKILSGVEFNTVYDGVAFHLLAYDFDYRKLEPWIYENYEIKKPNLQKEFEYMVQSCKKNHIKIGNLFYDKEKGWPIDVIFSEIKKYEDNKKFFKKTECLNMLSSTTSRQNFVRNVTDAAVSLGLDGINVDFEQLSSDCGPHYVEFIRELSHSDIVQTLRLSKW